MRALLDLLPWLCAATLSAQSLSPAVVRHVSAAQQAEARQDCHTAAAEFGQAARLMPVSGELRSNVGVALYCDDQLAAAVSSFQAALKLNQELAAPHLFLGFASYRLGDPATATRELQMFLERKPDDQVAHLWLGYALVAQHRYLDASSQFEEVRHAEPTNLDAEYALGQTYLEIGREKARQLEALAPDGSRVLQLAGEQYQLLGDTARAETAFQQSRARSAEAVSSAGSLAKQDALYREAHDAEALSQEAFHALVTQAPESYRAHQITADTLLLQQNETGALAEYRIVAVLDPKLPEIHEAIANCLMEEAHFAEAVAELHLEEQLQPQSSRVAMDLGRAELAMGDDRGAVQSLQQALDRREPPPETYLLLGRAGLRTGDATAAVRSLLRYLAAKPDSAAAYYLLAKAYRIQGDKEASSRALIAYQRLSQETLQRQLTRTLTRDPKNVEAQLTAGDLDQHGAPASQQP